MKSDRKSRRTSARSTSRVRSDILLASLVAAIRDTVANDERAAIRFVELLEQQLHELEQRQETIEGLLAMGDDATRTRMRAALERWVTAIGTVVPTSDDATSGDATAP